MDNSPQGHSGLWIDEIHGAYPTGKQDPRYLASETLDINDASDFAQAKGPLQVVTTVSLLTYIERLRESDSGITDTEILDDLVYQLTGYTAADGEADLIEGEIDYGKACGVACCDRTYATAKEASDHERAADGTCWRD